jgi:GxxExxY protein
LRENREFSQDFSGLSLSGCIETGSVPINHNGVVIDSAFRADLMVERRLLIELKSTERASALYPKQLLTYLPPMNLPSVS